MTTEQSEQLQLEITAMVICGSMRVDPLMIVCARVICGYVVPRTWFDVVLENVRQCRRQMRGVA